MASANDTASMALFCDFENIALGVRDAQYEKFDIRPVLERLLAKGSIVVKKAYCDWDRYKGFKSSMHEANFELIEIPHVRQSGKNSADIRMVVDALDLCYTKSHVDTFVIISGDSDFSPLVSKLRENAKKVIGVGVKQSCSDLLVTNCDEFIYYDDLVRDREARVGTPRREREKRSPEEEARRREKSEERKAKAVEIVSATFVDLMADRGESERIWASVLKEVVKRRNPGFNESYYGFRSFGGLLEEAANRGLLGFGRDDKGAFVFRAQPRPVAIEPEPNLVDESLAEPVVVLEIGEPQVESEAGVIAAETLRPEASVTEATTSGNGRRRGARRTRGGKDRQSATEVIAAVAPTEIPAPETPEPVEEPAVVVEASVVAEPPEEKAKPRRGVRRPHKTDAATTSVAEPVAEQPAPEAPTAKAKRPARSPRARKPKVIEGAEG